MGQSRMTLLRIRLLVHYSFWSSSDLMNIIELFAKNQIVFGRDSMSYQIIMPLKRKYAKHAAFGSETVSPTKNVKNKIKKMQNEYEYEQHSKYEKMQSDDVETSIGNGVIDKNSLKGIASYVKQKNVGKLQIISSQNGMRDEDIVIIEKLRIEKETMAKYELYKEFFVAMNQMMKKRKSNKSMIVIFTK